jgi:hypothetical protein
VNVLVKTRIKLRINLILSDILRFSASPTTYSTKSLALKNNWFHPGFSKAKTCQNMETKGQRTIYKLYPNLKIKKDKTEYLVLEGAEGS